MPLSGNDDQDKVEDSTYRRRRECFPLLIAISNKNIRMLRFLWEDLRYLWDLDHLDYILRELIALNYKEGIPLILQSSTTQDIYLGHNSI